MATFGNTTTTTSTGTATANNKYHGTFAMPEDGWAISISAYLKGGSSTYYARLGIYGPAAVLASSTPLAAQGDSQITIPASAALAWYTVNLPAPVFLAAGTYSISCLASGAFSVARPTTGGTGGYSGNTYSLGFEDPNGSVASTNTNKYCYYVN